MGYKYGDPKRCVVAKSRNIVFFEQRQLPRYARSDAGAGSITDCVWSPGSQDLRDHQDAMATTEHEDASDTDIDASNDSAPPP